MLENAPHIPDAEMGRFGPDGSAQAETTGDALRKMDWNELTARLNAARDVRHVLQRDATRSIEASANSFADAAARYFRTKEEGERCVNPNTLEQSKGSPGIVPVTQGLDNIETQIPGQAETSDARED